MADGIARKTGGKLQQKSEDKDNQADQSTQNGSSPKSGFSIKIQLGEKRKIPGDEGPKKGTVPLLEKKTKIQLTPDKEKEKIKPQKPMTILPKKTAVASVFNEDSDSEEEEMPKEAKMRMRNIGRDTPTSAGPNSFNKGKLGFVNQRKVWEQSLKPRTHLEAKPPSDI